MRRTPWLLKERRRQVEFIWNTSKRQNDASWGRGEWWCRLMKYCSFPYRKQCLICIRNGCRIYFSKADFQLYLLAHIKERSMIPSLFLWKKKIYHPGKSDFSLTLGYFSQNLSHARRNVGQCFFSNRRRQQWYAWQILSQCRMTSCFRLQLNFPAQILRWWGKK